MRHHFKDCSFFWPSRTALLFLLTASIFFAEAQTLPNRRYTTRDGLIADRITAITQDGNGFMWMGSIFGLCKYDGNTFTTIDLPASQRHKAVTTLLAVDKKIYAGFLFGGGLLQYENGRATAYSITDKNAITNDIVGLYNAGNGILVVNNVNQVFLFSKYKFSYLFSLDSSYGPSSINSIYDDNGRIWVGTPTGLKIFEHGRFKQTVLQGSSISSVRQTTAGLMVAGSAGSTVFIKMINYKNFPSITLTTLLEQSHLLLIPFYGNQDNFFWGLDSNRGLLNISDKGQVKFIPTTIDKHTEIKCLYADRENNLWLASDPGVLKISNLPVTSYAFGELAVGGGDIVKASDTSYWTTNSKYLYHISNNNIKKVQEFRNKNETDFLGSLITDNENHLWVCGWNKGLWRLKYSNEKLVSKQYFNKYQGVDVVVNCMDKDSNGNIWAAGFKGIFCINEGRIIDHFKVSVSTGSNAFITSIAVDETKKTIWTGDNAGGIIKISYQPSGNKFVYEITGHFNQQHGLSDTYIRSLYLDSGKNLWVGTRLGGIYVANTADDKPVYFKQITTAGISCTRVTDIAGEGDKAIWFATCEGILRYSVYNKNWQKYGVNEGLLGAEVFSLAIDKSNQKVSSVSTEGVTYLNFDTNGVNLPPPLINITGLSVLGEKADDILLSGKEKKLSASENSIGFEFAAASYANEKKIKYRYMLAGYDKAWSVPVQSNNVNYLSLPSGHYNFKVIAWNGYQWSTEPASFSFHIIQPFYKTAWFLALVVAILMFSFYLVRMYRLKQKLKLEKLRLNIARDLHDDIGSALGSINLLSENANRHLSANKPAEEVAGTFQKIGYSAQMVLDSMDDIIWAINPEKDSLKDLLIRMREFAIPLLEARGIHFSINMQAEEDMKPSMELKRNIYLIFKEAIFNIVRHSGSAKVEIDVLFGSKTFEMKIADNGKGFDKNILTSRNGLKNMKKRAIMSGADLHIHSEPGEGTVIKLKGIFK